MKRILKHLSGVALLAMALFLAPAFFASMAGVDAGAAYAGTAGVVANASGPTNSGVALGTSDTPQGLFGNAITQPANPSQALASYALGQSAMVVYLSAQTPAAVNANTTAEQAFTVTGVAAGSVVAISKPTTQAGLGIVGVRVSAANTIQVNYCNVTAGNITPTAAQNYWVVEFRGSLIQSTGVIAPTAVATVSTSEQYFTLVPAAGSQGLSTAKVANEPGSYSMAAASSVPATAGSSAQLSPVNVTTPALSGFPQCLIVNKPTGQAGLGYWARISDNNQLALGFSNTSGAPITPTAEAYSFIALRGLALMGEVTYGVNVGTLAQSVHQTAVQQTVTVNGLATTDVIKSVIKPTNQDTISLSEPRVTAANTLGFKFTNPTAATDTTPTASEIYLVAVDKTLTGKGAALAQFSGVLAAPVAVATITGAEQSITMTGLVSGAPVVGFSLATGAGFGSALGGKLPAGIIPGGVRASGTDTLAVNLLNVTAANITPPSLQAICLQAPIDSSGSAAAAAGSFVAYPIDNQRVQMTEMANALQKALAKLGVSAV